MYLLPVFQISKIWSTTEGLILFNKSQQEPDGDSKHLL